MRTNGIDNYRLQVLFVTLGVLAIFPTVRVNAQDNPPKTIQSVLDEALVSAQKIKFDVDRARQLIKIGIAQARAGDQQGSQKTLQLVVAETDKLFKTDLQPTVRVWLVCGCTKLRGQQDQRVARRSLDDAVLFSRKIAAAHDKSEALKIIADTEIELGHFTSARHNLDQAVKFAKQIADATDRGRRLNVIAISLVNAGNARKALSVAQVAATEGYYCWAMPTIATAIAHDGDIELAIDLLNDLSASTAKLALQFRAQELNHIAKVQLEIGEPDMASRTIAEVLLVTKQLTPFWQVELFCLASETQTELDYQAPLYYDQALALARTIEDPIRKIVQLTFVAKSLARIGDLERCRKVLEEALAMKVKDKDASFWMKQLSISYAESGFPKEALMVSKHDRLSDRDHVECLLSVANAMIQAKQEQNVGLSD